MAIAFNILDQTSADFEPAFRVVAALNDHYPDLPSGQVNLMLVDDEEIEALNKEYTGNAYPTDVLSFSYIEGGEEPIEGELGDIAISLPMATAQAEAAGTSVDAELALLALHGTLHVIGYDHQTPEEREKMDRIQRNIMTAAGLPYRDFAWKE